MTPAIADLSIADLGITDLPDLQRIMDDAFDPQFGEAWSSAQCLGVLAMPGYRVRIARIGTRRVGFAIFRHVADESELLLIGVRRDARRMGVGAMLMQDWFAQVSSQGETRLFLEMRFDNPARLLYQQLGFVEVGVRPNYYRGADGVMRDALTMQRNPSVN